MDGAQVNEGNEGGAAAGLSRAQRKRLARKQNTTGRKSTDTTPGNATCSQGKKSQNDDNKPPKTASTPETTKDEAPDKETTAKCGSIASDSKSDVPPSVPAVSAAAPASKAPVSTAGLSASAKKKLKRKLAIEAVKAGVKKPKPETPAPRVIVAKKAAALAVAAASVDRSRDCRQFQRNATCRMGKKCYFKHVVGPSWCTREEATEILRKYLMDKARGGL